MTKTPFKALRSAGNGRWAARDEQGFALFDETGVPLTPFHYSQINNFHEDIAVFRRDDLCGFMNLLGEEVLPPQYGLAWDFQEGLARAAFRDGIAFVNKDGEIPFIPAYSELRDYSEGLAPFQEN